MSILLKVFFAILESQLGRLALAVVIAGSVGFYKGDKQGFQRGDEGRIKLEAAYEQATRKLLIDEAMRSRRIVEESLKEAEIHEANMAEKDKLLEAANAEIEKLEAGNKQCGVVSRATVRKLNSSR